MREFIRRPNTSRIWGVKDVARACVFPCRADSPGERLLSLQDVRGIVCFLQPGLILRDVDANLSVGFIPNAIP